MVQVNQRNNTMDKTITSLEVIFNRKVFGFVLIVSLVLLLSSVMSHNVFAQKSGVRKKTVTSILIEPGDTLWSIATKYYTEEYESIPVYIEEIKKSNRLYTEEIHAGKYIIVPYYYDVN
ncbi:LysM peptidoglycan-binding domain-containing protein [Clostridium sp. Marseille-P299]|uniref:LysM peptidoglycan-binding domain-containing protein n=1 Tax=Clostridium sp. Marseille-P299 TaxID=1805477 RepID=UPI00082ED9E9|nr:LysM peptidoglycan-binding domain-containing protein [Clostridium sp. Marseille-P299]